MSRGGFVLAIAVGAIACAPRPPLLDRAIAARGGPLPALVRELRVEVREAFPGTWGWQTVFALPDRYAWTIETADRPNHYLFDGTVVRAFLGDALVAEDASPDAPLRSQARFVAVASLDALRLPGVSVADAGGRLEVVFPRRGDRYTVAFDGRLLVARVEGPVDFSPFARGTLVARYDDVRRTGGLLLAHRTRYALDGAPLADEQTLVACVLRTGLPAAAFASPGALPGCP